MAKSLQSLCRGLCEQNVMWILLLEGSLGVEKAGNKETFRKLLHVSSWETVWRGRDNVADDNDHSLDTK